MKKILITSAATFLGASAFGADLKICVEGAFPPFSETAEDGTVTGFDVDIANALCDEMGKSCEMVKVDWDGIIPALLEKKCDAIIASMSITPERQEVVDFSGKYYNAPNMFIAKEGTKLADIAGLKVGVQRGTIHNDYMEKVYPDTELVLYGTQDEVFLDLAAGRIDATVGDAVQGDQGFLQTDAGKGFAFVEDKDITDPEIHGIGAGVGVRKEDTELRDAFSAGILAIRENGKYKEINDKYFTFDIYGTDEATAETEAATDATAAETPEATTEATTEEATEATAAETTEEATEEATEAKAETTTEATTESEEPCVETEEKKCDVAAE